MKHEAENSGLRLRNTLTKQKELFEPINKSQVTMYTCGPTVYDYASIGNFSAYLMADLVKRYLEHLGYSVTHVTNITDVGHLTADADVAGEDKLEAAAKKEGLDHYKIAEKYTKQFLDDAKALGVTADIWPKASDHIPEMISMIEKMVKNGSAYITENGVYFDVTKDPHYGELSGNTLDQLKAGARVEINPDKKRPADFALWKLNQPNHIMQWDSPWGKGYPGWHIECSAMSTKYLGDQIDIHTGGEDNIFPHHECEIAQTESATGKRPFVKYWLHKQFLTVDGQKMSKSLGNIYRLKDLEEKGFDPEDFRMLILSAHYRSSVNFTWEGLQAARERRLRWRTALQNSLTRPSGSPSPKGEEDTTNFDFHEDSLSLRERARVRGKDQYFYKLDSALNDDLNTPEAFALIDEQVKLANSGQTVSSEFWQTVDNLFGLGLARAEEVSAEIETKRKELDIARQNRNYEIADRLRQEIIDAGYDVITTASGTVIRKK